MSSEKKPGRPKKVERIPLGVHHAKLSVAPGLIPNDKVGRWINDIDNRIQQALAGGYEFVYATDNSKIGDGPIDGNTDIGGKISKAVGTIKDTKETMRAYLMTIRKDWYDEDQAKKQEKVDSIDAAIRRPGFGADQKGVGDNNLYGRVDYKA